MNKVRLMVAALCLCHVGVVLAQNPLWDLKRDKPSETKGTVQFRADGTVLLDEASAFAVPDSAFPDQQNFTVKITMKYPQLGTKANCGSVVSKEGEIDSGFGFSIFRNIYTESYMGRVNRLYASANAYAGNKGRADVEVPVTYTIFARDGLVSFYRDDRPGAKIYAKPIACKEPMWVGLNRKNFGNLEIVDLKVYGKDFDYQSPNEKIGKDMYIVRPGKGWNINAPRGTDPTRPRVLIYGDSISMGYCPVLRHLLRDKAYVEHWTGFVYTARDCKAETYAGAGAALNYKAIVFNNGLHSTHWTKDKVTDEQIAESYRRIVQGFRKGAPQAKLIYLNTTPVSDKSTPRGPDVRNEVVVRLNEIAAKVMKEEGIEVIDMYSKLFPMLDEMTDNFHWKGIGYKMIAEAVCDKILSSL